MLKDRYTCTLVSAMPREVGVPAGEGDGDYMLGTMSISMFHPHESDRNADPILLYRIQV
jgi:hypothetical protein